MKISLIYFIFSNVGSNNKQSKPKKSIEVSEAAIL